MAESLKTADLDAIVDAYEVHGASIYRRLMKSFMSRAYFTEIDFNDVFIHHRGSSTSMVQSYQGEFTEGGEINLAARKQRHSAWKVDLKFEPRKYSTRSYLASVAQRGSNPSDLPYAEWIIETQLLQILEDHALGMMWTGRDRGVIDNAKNNVGDVADGMFYKIQKAQQAGEITPLISGPISKTQADTQLEDWVFNHLPSPDERMRPMQLHCAQKAVDYYRKSYRANQGTNIHANEFGHSKLDGTNIVLVPHSGFGNSDALIMTPFDNFFYGRDGEPNFKIQEHLRKLYFMWAG